MPALEVFYGGGDMIELLDDATERVRTGELVGVVIVGLTEPDGEPHCGWSWAHRDGISSPWARLLAATAATQHELIANGLDG